MCARHRRVGEAHTARSVLSAFARLRPDHVFPGISGKLLLDKMRVDDLVVAAYTRWALLKQNLPPGV